MVAAAVENVIEIEIDGPQNEHVVFRPLQRRIRGRFDLLRVNEPQAKLRLNEFPKPIPGQRIAIDLTTKEGWIREPLRDPENAELAAKLTRSADGRSLRELPPAREVFADIDVSSWAYYMACEVAAGNAKLVRGALPDHKTLKPRKNWYTQRPDADREDSIAIALRQLAKSRETDSQIQAKLLEVLTKLAAKL
jgi:hypothetical protein